MAGVILVLGLIAAGVYTGDVGFYWAAGVLGALWFIIMFLILGVATGVKKQVTKMNDDPYKHLRSRKR